MKFELTKEIKKRFDAEGIEIPYPYRNVVIKDKPTTTRENSARRLRPGSCAGRISNVIDRFQTEMPANQSEAIMHRDIASAAKPGHPHRRSK